MSALRRSAPACSFVSAGSQHRGTCTWFPAGVTPFNMYSDSQEEALLK